jgi:hypothetical protein
MITQADLFYNFEPESQAKDRDNILQEENVVLFFMEKQP